MKFEPPQASLDYWKKRGADSVPQPEIDSLEEHTKLKAPDSYREFLSQYGAVEFDHEINSQFAYRYPSDEQGNGWWSGMARLWRKPEVKTELISFVKKPAMAIKYYDGLQEDADLALPEFLIPFGMDYGEGELLIEFGQATERIYYWDSDAHDWETGETKIGFVADDFYQFINSLAPYDEPE